MKAQIHIALLASILLSLAESQSYPETTDCSLVKVNDLDSCQSWCQQGDGQTNTTGEIAVQSTYDTNSHGNIIDRMTGYTCECRAEDINVTERACQATYEFPTCQSVGVNNCSGLWTDPCTTYCGTFQGFNYTDVYPDTEMFFWTGDFCDDSLSFEKHADNHHNGGIACYCGFHSLKPKGDDIGLGLAVCGDEGWNAKPTASPTATSNGHSHSGPIGFAGLGVFMIAACLL